MNNAIRNINKYLRQLLLHITNAYQIHMDAMFI